MRLCWAENITERFANRSWLAPPNFQWNKPARPSNLICYSNSFTVVNFGKILRFNITSRIRYFVFLFCIALRIRKFTIRCIMMIVVYELHSFWADFTHFLRASVVIFYVSVPTMRTSAEEIRAYANPPTRTFPSTEDLVSQQWND